MRSRLLAPALAVLAAVGCNEVSFGPQALPAPSQLTYQLEPSGDPDRPAAVVLRWSAPYDDRVTSFVVYSRPGTAGEWYRRAEVSTTSYIDEGVPHVQYYVAAQGASGEESIGSNVVTIDERNRLPAPSALASVSLDGAVQLTWSDAARLAVPTRFSHYRVYSTVYSLDADRCDPGYWVLEGTTISEDFLASGLSNGAPRCFAVSAVSREGYESLWSAARADTPRPDARNVFLYPRQADVTRSGFLFEGSGGALGVPTAGDRTDIDFRVDRDVEGRLWLVPVRADVRIALYSTSPVEDLTSIDVAPARSQFSRDAFEAVPGYAYVVETQRADGLHYAAVRVTHASPDYLLFDWAYQTDPGNPELTVALPTPFGS